MRKSQRQSLIIEQVQNAAPQALLSTRELAGRYDVSETTIRRDFQELADTGLIQRQYGGVQLSSSPDDDELGTVGILLLWRIDKYRDPFYSMVLEGVDTALGRLGYHPAYVKTLFEIDTSAKAQALIDTFAVKGIVLLGTADTDSIRYLRDHFSPIVTMTDNHDLEEDVVLFDGIRGMRLMVEHLASLGYRRLAYITGYADVRYAGFCRGLAENGLLHEEALHQILKPGPSGWTPDLGERGARNLMTSGLNPDVIVCASDRLAIGAMAWLQRNGYQVPGDVAVTGFDNIPDSQFTYPPLTTVQVYKVRLGELAAERLVQRIEKPDDVKLKIITPTSLVIRQSCGSRF